MKERQSAVMIKTEMKAKLWQDLMESGDGDQTGQQVVFINSVTQSSPSESMQQLHRLHSTGIMRDRFRAEN